MQLCKKLHFQKDSKNNFKKRLQKMTSKNDFEVKKMSLNLKNEFRTIKKMTSKKVKK